MDLEGVEVSMKPRAPLVASRWLTAEPITTEPVTTEPISEEDLSRALENLAVGMTLVIAQGIVATNPWFGEQQVREYLKARREFYGPFIFGASIVSEWAETVPAVRPAAAPLARIAKLPRNQFQQALVQGARAFKSLGRIRPSELDLSPAAFRAILSLNKVLQLVNPKEQGDYFRYQMTLEQLLSSVIKIQSVPTKIKTLLRQLSKLQSSVSPEDYQIGANPGAWFDMSSDERETIRYEVAEAKSYQKALMESYDEFTDKDIWRERLTQAGRDLAEVQGRAGVNVTLIEEADAEPLDTVLRREKKLQRDGPTEWVLNSLKSDLSSSFEEYPTQRGYMTKRELGKLLTQLEKANTFDSMQRIMRAAVNRKLVSPRILDSLVTKVGLARRNKALRDGVPLVPLVATPITAEDFQAKFDTGRIDFQGEWGEDQKKELLGRVAGAVETLESIFGQGFCGEHAKKLEFRFASGSAVGAFAKAQYFGWENRNRWQPRVTFSEDYQGLLAHELSHYFEDLLAYKIEDELHGVPAYQYGGVGHGPGDIFGSTGMDARDWVERLANPLNPDAKNLVKFEEFPELIELFESIVASEDFARWEDRIGAALEMTLPEAVRAAGLDPYEEPGRSYIDAKYKSEVPAEIIADASQRYTRSMDGDSRKLTYYNSTTEVWARMMEQYVYTKLSRAGIANPWLTQLTYDPDVMDQFMAEETFEGQVEPIFDKLFASLKGRGIVTAMARQIAARWLVAKPRASDLKWARLPNGNFSAFNGTVLVDVRGKRMTIEGVEYQLPRKPSFDHAEGILSEHYGWGR